MCGDADLWWPYVKSVTRSVFKSQNPQIGFSINNSGVNGGEFDLIDAVDPHTHMVIRGMFGITPDVPNDTFYITPSFPTSWNNASIKTPKISYSYDREGDVCRLAVESSKPSIKVIVPYPGCADKIVTPKELRSVVEFKMPLADTVSSKDKPVVIADKSPRPALPPISEENMRRILMLDLSDIYNTTLNILCTETEFISDVDACTTIAGWWGTTPGKTGKGSEIVCGTDGVKFLIKGRNMAAEGKGKNLIALSSWGKKNGGYSLPAAVVIPIERKTEKIWLLLQSYVCPMKNYIPNGEIVLHYEDGTDKLIQLIPPYNLDTYYQPFARAGSFVELGELSKPQGWSACHTRFSKPNALELPIECDAAKVLKSIEVRGTCSEGVIGVTAVTVLPAK